MNNSILLFLFSFIFVGLNAQFEDNFDDGNLNMNPSWEGDVNNFIVNNDLELQLSASEGGTSSIFISTSFPDSIEWELYFKMDFSPSGSNALRINLIASDNNEDLSDGYYLEIGESGSNDAFNFYRNDGGNGVLLGTGSLGALGGNQAIANLKVTLNESGLWSFFADYEESGCLLLDFEVFDNTYGPQIGQFFGFKCTYTSTRIDKFFFDDIKLNVLTPDTEGPIVTNVAVQGSNSVLITFNEFVSESTIENLSNYSIDQSIGNPSSAIIIGNKQVELQFNQEFISGVFYQMDISGIEDLFGNTIANPSSHDLFLTESPDVGDILINEILFDPYPNFFDYIELYNNSTKFINLKGAIIENTQRNEDFVFIEDDLIVFPGEYLALTENKSLLVNVYSLLFPENVVSHDLPSFNNDEGNISVFSFLDGNKVSVDSFNYDEGFHNPLLFDTEGVSLERISFLSGSDDPENWHSAAENAGFGTPGYKNSQFYEGMVNFEDPFELSYKVFSPNNDGDKDILIINYELDQPGFAANIKIFDVKGRLVKILTRNLLLGTSGFVKWNGTSGDSELASLGIYIVQLELIHPSGDINNFKKTCVLADFLN